MLPIVANIYTTTPIQTPLVNTTLPGTVVAHVPYDNVAPSVSNAQVENNSKGSSEPPAAVASEPPATQSSAEEIISAAGDPANLGTVAQATFLAQLMGQDGSSQTQGMLAEYEKLVSLSNVKYKPSNAMKPPPAPAGVFGKLLHAEKVAAQAPHPVQATIQEPHVAAAPAQIPDAPAAKAAPAAASAATDSPAIVPAAIDAYAAVMRRNAAITADAPDNNLA